MRSAIRETGALWRRCNSRAVAGKMQEESRASVGPECTNRLEEEKKKKKRWRSDERDKIQPNVHIWTYYLSSNIDNHNTGF